MLILSRKVGEEIVIDGRIRVRVHARKHGCIQLAIDAPDFMYVDRAEIDKQRQVHGVRKPRPACVPIPGSPIPRGAA
jgi:carbon storage regulator CsrA